MAHHPTDHARDSDSRPCLVEERECVLWRDTTICLRFITQRAQCGGGTQSFSSPPPTGEEVVKSMDVFNELSCNSSSSSAAHKTMEDDDCSVKTTDKLCPHHSYRSMTAGQNDDQAKKNCVRKKHDHHFEYTSTDGRADNFENKRNRRRSQFAIRKLFARSGHIYSTLPRWLL